jgi:hypothetical protein
MGNISEMEQMFAEQQFKNKAKEIATTLKYDNKEFKPELLLNWNENQIKDFIRERLRIIEPETISDNVRCKGTTEEYITFLEILTKQHRRFKMSGYEVKTGQCTTKNQEILNLFADLGVYDYTYYLFLDFYKGTPTLYLKYWGHDENLEFTYDGYGTVEIIYEIFKLTILNNENLSTRRRF